MKENESFEKLQERLRAGDKDAEIQIGNMLSGMSRGPFPQTATNHAARIILEQLRKGKKVEHPERLLSFLRGQKEKMEVRRGKALKRRPPGGVLESLAPEGPPDPSDEWDQCVEAMDFKAVLNSLDEATKEIVVRHLLNMTLEKIAQELNCEIKDVKEKLDDAISLIRRLMRDDNS